MSDVVGSVSSGYVDAAESLERVPNTEIQIVLTVELVDDPWW